MKIERSSGVLLHITSLPGKFGIGTLGQEARRFADLLAAGGQRYWQILPIGPVSAYMGYCPYASTSTFAGNDLFISPERLSEYDWFRGKGELSRFPEDDFVDFDRVAAHRRSLLCGASEDFFSRASSREQAEFEGFCREAQSWLEDYALFAALAEHFNTNHWLGWEKPIRLRDAGALAAWREKLGPQVRFYKFVQHLFFKQWADLKQYCRQRGVSIIGDIPIYITFDGADAWAHPEIFQLDAKTGRPKAVSGVPPDYFSETGQRWGNPLYRWTDRSGGLNRQTFDWWVHRVRHLNALVDVIRIDHFRAFETYWAIPAKEKTAVNGKWVKGPGAEFFHALRDELGELPFIAEDLGDITPAVEKLRDDLELPGMKILQFAFDGSNKNYYLPHNYRSPDFAVYTGTHDNNTTNGWFYGSELDDPARQAVMEYIGTDTFSDFHWHLNRMAYRSTAVLAILPAQDILGYGEKFRMNRPGTVENNWRWKLKQGCLTPDLMKRLRRMGVLYDRVRE